MPPELVMRGSLRLSSSPAWRGTQIGLRAVAIACAALFAPGTEARAAEWRFDVEFTESAHARPYSGRVYVFFSQRNREPRFGPNWFRPELFIARDVSDWRPGERLTFSTRETAGMLAFPGEPAEIDPAGFRAQAVVRFNPRERNVGTGPGNGFSPVVTAGAETLAEPPLLTVDRLVPPREFRETRWTRLIEVRSRRLSEFHGRDEALRGAVMLPASYYDQPERRYPAVFIIPGFGGDHFEGITNEPVRESNEAGVEFLRVVLDPGCPLGHHTFADSANNGPVGEALVTEFLPEFDRRFRSVAAPTGRFLTGHSSGGWSSLWLQVTYPDMFGGTWSTSPDPVDFRDFQRIDLYRPGENMYVDGEGNERPIARAGERVLLWYRSFARMEWVLGHGGQLHSFEAVFSPRGDDGRPQLVFDRDSGAVDTGVARTWEPYDIRLVLERNWPALGPRLAGKLHVFMGDQDTFLLEGATVRMKESLERLGSDAVVEIHPGKDHGSLLTAALRERIRREMTAAFLKQHDAR
ncbi:MAG TPA: alpha/beta hydrolase-fold protein [Planctomycetaceae bacterium]|nr:alpha/beta hydrolase-fold protein [Planctomycetaceae bacterium]